MNALRRWFGHLLLAAVVALAGATSMLLLVRSGHGSLQLPTDRSLDGVRAWAAERDAITIAMALLRLAAIGLAAQLGLTTTCSALGVAMRLPSLVRAADLLSLPGTRTLVRQGATLVLSAASLVEAPAGGGPAPAPAGTVTLERSTPSADTADGVAAMTRLTSGGGTATLERTPVSTSTASATLSRVPASGGTAALERIETAPPPDAAPAPRPAARPATAAASGAAGGSSTWTVRPGDHLWSIAEATLADAWDHPPADHEITRYWRQVVRANRWLTDPDLVRPGQVVTLPPVQSAHA